MPRRTRSLRHIGDSQAGDSGQPGGQQASGGSGSVNLAGNDQLQFQTQILQALAGVSQAMQAMQLQIQQALPAQPASPAPQPQPIPTLQDEPTHPTQPKQPAQLAPSQSWQGGGRSFAEFKSLAPAPFCGSTNPADAEKWVREMEKAFAAHGSQEDERIRFATYLLQGEAYDWLLLVEQRLDGHAISWGEFKEVFYDKYFPNSVQRQMESEFIKLEQRNLSVAQYEAEFTRLARFAPDIVTTERAKIIRFTEGLRPRLMQAVNAFELSTYSAVVNKALVIERDMGVVQREWEQQRKRKESSSGQSSGQAKKKGAHHASSGQKGKETNCPHCGRSHWGRRCHKLSGACFICGKEDHKMATCPLRKDQQPPSERGMNQQQPPKTQGRVFTLTQQDAAASNSVVTGTPVT